MACAMLDAIRTARLARNHGANGIVNAMTQAHKCEQVITTSNQRERCKRISLNHTV